MPNEDVERAVDEYFSRLSVLGRNTDIGETRTKCVGVNGDYVGK